MTEIKTLSKQCNFGDLEESLLRDKIVVGVRDVTIQERLLRIENLTLQKAELQCRASEASRLQQKELRNTQEVDVVNIKRSQVNTQSNKNYNCLKCGKTHAAMKCPAYGKVCNICKKLNHFAVGCKNKNNNLSNKNQKSNNNNKNQRKTNVNEICNEENVIIDTIYLDNINVNNTKTGALKTWYVDAKINNKNIKLKLDTGASCNCMPYQVFKDLGLVSEIVKDSVSIVTYGNNKIKTLGNTIIKCNINDIESNIRFILVDVESTPVLGLNACVKLNLLKRVDSLASTNSKNDFIKNNSDIFEGTGKIPFEYKIILKKNAQPFVSSCRRVAETIKPKLKEALDDLCNRGIIYKIDEPTEWVNNIVIVEKSNKTLRICLDPVHLNQNVVLDQFPIPTLDELALKLKDKCVFTVLDLKEGFYHVPLETEST